jgi:hypothetical protein
LRRSPWKVKIRVRVRIGIRVRVRVRTMARVRVRVRVRTQLANEQVVPGEVVLEVGGVGDESTAIPAANASRWRFDEFPLALDAQVILRPDVPDRAKLGETHGYDLRGQHVVLGLEVAVAVYDELEDLDAAPGYEHHRLVHAQCAVLISGLECHLDELHTCEVRVRVRVRVTNGVQVECK